MFLSENGYPYAHLRIGKDNSPNHTLEIPFVFPKYPGRLIHNPFIIIFTQTYLHIQISTSLLIIHSLRSLPPSDIPRSHLPTLLASLRLSLEISGPSASLISALHLQWRDAADAIGYENIYCHLQLLDSYLSNQWETPHIKCISQEAGQEHWSEINADAIEKARDEWLVDDLIALGVCTELELQTQGDLKQSKSAQ